MAIWPAAGQEILENLKTAGQIGIGGRLPAAGQIATAIFNTPMNTGDSKLPAKTREYDMTPSDQKRNVVMHDIRTVCRYPKALQTHKYTHIQIDFESGILKA